MADLDAKTKRTVLELLDRDSLAGMTDALDLAVADRRSKDAHIDAIVRARSLDFAEVLGMVLRDGLKAMCEVLGLDSSGREREVLIDRILNRQRVPAAAPGTNFALSVPEPKRKKPRAPTAARSTGGEPTADYRHDATRKNNPPAGLIDLDKPPPRATRKYGYDPHLDPQLQWSGKKEHTSFEVDTVSLHIHERVSAQAIMRAVKREDAQRSLFGEESLPEGKAIDFYAHDVGWSNRLVLGDSLLVMNSLLEREQMAGKVQCIYVDPPYGVQFNSNFQPLISRRDVKDGDDGSLTREPEQIQAYRDTWTLGIHSYLTYLRDRLLLARELLAESGSIFVQISDENLHHVRELMDEVFGPDNFISVIAFTKTGGATSALLPMVTDFIVWYARDRPSTKYRPLFLPKTSGGEGATGYVLIESPDRSTWRPMTKEERADPRSIPPGWRIFDGTPLVSSGFRTNTTVPFTFEGKVYHPGQSANWKTTLDGMQRLAKSGRILSIGNRIEYKRYLDDFPVAPLTNVWLGLGERGFTGDKLYVVQTAREAIQRCVLMTTDPGDLVLDPTCGSGTTAYVAEQWGRRWITADTSRVALAIARQRILTARFPYYVLRSDKVKDGFTYKTVPHITLKSIAINERLDSCNTQEERERLIRQTAEQEVLNDQPEEDKGKVRVSGPFTVEAIPVASMEDPSDSPVPSLAPDARDDDLARPGRGVAEVGGAEYGATAGADYTAYMVDLLKKSGGVHFKNGKTLPLTTLRPVKTVYEWLHAESETGFEGEDPRRVAVSFGPRHAPVTPKQVIAAIQQTRGYDIVLFVGFACDPEALRVIETGTSDRIFQFVHAAPDILVGDLVKTSKTTKLFTVFGLPDVKVKKTDGEAIVTLTGVDIYDPTTGETTHDDGENVAAWFLDHDYDGRTFCVCQAFFPGGKRKSPWEKLQKALKGSIDEDRFESLRGTASIPFKPGKKVAVKVIDDRGNEVVKVVNV